MGKYISYRAAAEALRTMFGETDQDHLRPTEIYKIVGRDLSQVEQNKKWLTNRLTDLKHYDFVRSVYTKDSPKILDKVQLTVEGKKALATSLYKESQKEVTLESIAQDIKQFIKQNPSITVEFKTSINMDAD